MKRHDQKESSSASSVQPPHPDVRSSFDRRKFIKTAAGGTAALLAGLPQQIAFGRDTREHEGREHDGRHGNPPNILFIMLDQFRVPSVFPEGIRTQAEFLKRFTPNIYRLWEKGVKFDGHHTASVACTPSRGCIVTGLYAQQTWLCGTLTTGPRVTSSKIPQLRSEYPTYGKLLRDAGYQTPYFGKWHVSLLDPDQPGNGLEDYGFTHYGPYPDPSGANLQGTVGAIPDYPNDEDTSRLATQWLAARQPGEAPWCATVGFINPHDQEFFWAGTEFETYNALFNSPEANPAGLAPFGAYGINDPIVDPAENPLTSPPDYGYPALPPNWESSEQLAANKPSGQTFIRQFSHAVWGGITDQPGQNNFTVEEYPATELKKGIGNAPFDYWRRNLDSYTQIMSIVDQRVGEIIDALPAAVARETVIVFTSDHGDLNGAHGIVAGKIGTCYEEAYHVPLIVVDPSGRFTSHENQIRTGLTSTVDLLRLFVTLGHKGSESWLTGDMRALYGQRHNLLSMLKSPKAPGRDYLLFSYDERVPSYYDFLPNGPTPLHIAGMQTDRWKLGTYSNWTGEILLPDGTSIPGAVIDSTSLECEFYDYSTRHGRLELDNLCNSRSRKKQREIARLVKILLEELVPNELRAPLPAAYLEAQTIAEISYLYYADYLTTLSPSVPEDPSEPHTGYGRDF